VFRVAGVAAAVVGAALIVTTASPQSYEAGEVRVSSHAYAPPQAAVRVRTNEVQVEVVVRDSKGMSIGGLTQEQFQLFDKGRLRKLSGFTPEVTQSAAPISGYAKPKNPTETAAVSATTSNVNPRARFVALFFDDIHMLPGDFRHAQIAAERFVNEAMASSDRVGIFTASATSTFDFSGDKSKLEEKIAALRARPMVNDGNAGDCPRITPYQAMQIVNGDLSAFEAAYLEYLRCHVNDFDGGRPPETMNPTLLNDPNYIRAHPEVNEVRAHAINVWDHSKQISSLTFDALRTAINHLSSASGDRMLLLASSGFISMQLEEEENEIIAAAVRSKIVINALDARGLFVEGPSRPPDVAAMEGRLSLATFLWDNTTRREKQQAEESSMENFAMATGGLLFRNNNDLDYGFYELGVVPAFSYMLSFSADDVRPDGALHALKVKVDRPNSYAEYRPGYYAPTTAAAGATESVPVKSKLDQAVTSQQNFSEIPATFVPKNAKSPDGKSELAVTIHVDLKSMPFKTENGREVERLDMVVALFDSAGNFVTGKSGEMDLALKSGTFVRLEATVVSGVLSLQAPPGSYRLRGVVQEAVSGKTAATSMAAEVQ